MAKAKEQQQLAEDELNLLQIQQAREMDPNAKADLTAKVQAKQSEVDVNKATTAAAQKALDDLEKDFKDSGAPDDWSQTEVKLVTFRVLELCLLSRSINLKARGLTPSRPRAKRQRLP